MEKKRTGNRKKGDLKRLLRYRIDQILAKGTAVMMLLVFASTAAIVFCVAPIIVRVSGGTYFGQAWKVLMHMVDGGTITQEETTNYAYLLVMLFVTVGGLLITSLLVGIMSAGVERFVSAIEKGTSTVAEEGHTVIIGFTDSIYTLIKELAQKNGKDGQLCIVVAGTQGIEEMAENVRLHVPSLGSVRMVYRSGPLSEEYMFERIGAENARSILVNRKDDGETVRIILALSSYLKDKELVYPELHITAAIRHARYVTPAQLAGGKRVEIVHEELAVSQIIAHTCGQSGVSDVIQEMLDFSGNELYIEPVPHTAGKRFRDLLNHFEHQVVFGIAGADGTALNPAMDTVLREGDELILFESDRGDFDPECMIKPMPPVLEEAIGGSSRGAEPERRDIIIIGWSAKIPAILEEYDHYAPAGTLVRILSDKEPSPALEEKELICIQTEWTRVEALEIDALSPRIDGSISNILLVSEEEKEEEDTRILMLLIGLREHAERIGKRLCVICELQKASDRKLAALAGADDSVVDTDVSILLAAQISADRRIAAVYRDILDYAGSELYIKPADGYVKMGKAVDFYTVTESAARKGEVAVGYKKVDLSTGKSQIVTNPKKSERVTFTKHDSLILLAEDWFTFVPKHF